MAASSGIDNGLFSIIEKQHLHELIHTFSECTGLSVQVLNETGKVLDQVGTLQPYCSLFKQYLGPGEACEKIHAKASSLAMKLGEAYIFSCHSHLNHIVFPLANNNRLLGSILAGPFLMDAPDALTLSGLADKYSIPIGHTLELFENATEIPILEPPRVTHISHLLYYMCSGLITDSRQLFTINQDRFHQQSAINESIQIYKTGSPISGEGYPYDKELALIAHVKSGDIDKAKALLNDLLGFVFFSEGSNLETIKSRAIGLSVLLSRATIEGGAITDEILRMNNQFTRELQLVSSLEDLCYLLQQVLDSFSRCMLSSKPILGSEPIKKAVHYIAQHFSAEIALEDVASYVGLNPSYFSTLFKQSTGSSFKEYLNMIRIEESKRLLSITDASIIEVALSSGFSDQSYFTKVFKKYTGFTPKQYKH